MRTARAAAVFAGALLAALVVLPCAAAERVITYSLAQRGDVGADFSAFEAVTTAAYADPRGWSLGGAVQFRRVASGGDFVLWLASPEEMDTFSDDCSPSWSCRVGRDVVINDLRFRSGSPYWDGPLDDYRLLLVNHETGHWIGFDHDACAGDGEVAPIMMQQSKGVGACVGNPWPRDDERLAAARLLGVHTTAALAYSSFDPPHTRGFTALPL